MLSSPLRMSVISPSSAPKDNGGAVTGMTNSPQSTLMSSSSAVSSHEMKTKQLSNKMATLETDINAVEQKINRLIRKRDERSKQCVVNATSAAALLINNNNNINNNKSSAAAVAVATLQHQMGGDANAPSHHSPALLPSTLHYTPVKPELNTCSEDSHSNWTVVKPNLALLDDPNSTCSESLRALQLAAALQSDSPKFTCTCVNAHSGEEVHSTSNRDRDTPLECSGKDSDSCWRSAYLDSLIEMNKKLTQDDLIHKIYTNNKKNVESLHRMVKANSFVCSSEVPKYAQPCEAPAYQANRKKFLEFKGKLVESIGRQKKALHEADQKSAEQYDSSYSQWISKVQSQKNSAKRRAKDAKNREFFEKIFPDLKKRREQDERIARMGTRGSGKSEFEIEEIASSLRQQELSECEMHRNAVVPPLTVTRLGTNRNKPAVTFIDNNRFIEDPLAVYKQAQNISSWTPHQQKLFRDKYLVHPKNFAAVSNATGKPIEECVKFYYLRKPTENYKKQLRSNSIKTKRTAPKMKHRPGTPQPSETPRSASPICATQGVSSSTTAVISTADSNGAESSKLTSSESVNSSSTSNATADSMTENVPVTTCVSIDSTTAATTQTPAGITAISTSNIPQQTNSSSPQNPPNSTLAPEDPSASQTLFTSTVPSNPHPSIAGLSSSETQKFSTPEKEEIGSSNAPTQLHPPEDVFSRVVSSAQKGLAKKTYPFTFVSIAEPASVVDSISSGGNVVSNASNLLAVAGLSAASASMANSNLNYDLSSSCSTLHHGPKFAINNIPSELLINSNHQNLIQNRHAEFLLKHQQALAATGCLSSNSQPPHSPISSALLTGSGVASSVHPSQQTDKLSPTFNSGNKVSVKNCCPVPLCTYKNKHRKLKCLNHKWDSLPQTLKDTLQNELGLSEDVTKACANCYNHITQLLDPEHVIGSSEDNNAQLQQSSSNFNQSNSSAVNNAHFSPTSSAQINPTGNAQTSSSSSSGFSVDEAGTVWTPEEEERLQSVLKSHGCDWERLAAAIPTKTDKQLKSFYVANITKFDHLLHEWSKSTVASRRNRIGSTSNATRSSALGFGRGGCSYETGNSNQHTVDSDDTEGDHLTDDADDQQPSLATAEEGNSNLGLTSNSVSSSNQMKSHILRKYEAGNGLLAKGKDAIENGSQTAVGKHAARRGSPFSQCNNNSSSTDNTMRSGKSIDEIIRVGMDSKVSAEDMDLRGTPILKLFSDPAASKGHQDLLQQRHDMQTHHVNRSGNSSSPPAAAKLMSNHPQTKSISALEIMHSHIRNLTNTNGDSYPDSTLSKQLRVNTPISNGLPSTINSISPSSEQNSAGLKQLRPGNPLEKTSPISPTPLNHSRPSSKGSSNAPPILPPLLHITSQLHEAHDRKSPLANNAEKIQQLVSSYGNNASAAAAAALGGSISQGIPVHYQSLLSEMTPEQQALVQAARQLPGGLLQLNGNALLMNNEFLRLSRERMENPRTSTAGLGASLKTVNNELIAADYVTSQAMDAALKVKPRTSPNNLGVVQPPTSSVNSAPRRPETIVAPSIATPVVAHNGALSAAAALQNFNPAFLDHHQAAYLLQSQPLLQQLYMPQSNKQLFVPPHAQANHLINWSLLNSTGATGAPPWPYPGPVPGATPPTSSSSLRAPAGSHAAAASSGFHQSLAAAMSNAAASGAGFSNGSLNAANEYARQLDDSMILQKLVECQQNEQLLKMYQQGAGKDHAQINLEALYNLGNPGAAAANAQEVNRLAAAQQQSKAQFDSNFYKSNPSIAVSVANAIASEREKAKVLNALGHQSMLAQHSNSNNYHLRRSASDMTNPLGNNNPNSLSNKNLVQQPSTLNSRVPSHNVASSSVPPVNKAPKLSPSEVREKSGEESSLDHMHRKRAISPSSGNPTSLSAPKKQMSSSDHTPNSDHVSTRSSSSGRVSTQQSSGQGQNCSNGASNIPSQPSQQPPNSSGNQGRGQQQPPSVNGPSGVSQGGDGKTGGTNGNGNGNNGTGGTSSNYQMQKPFSDKYCPTSYYRPQPMLKQSSKKDDHHNSGSLSGSAKKQGAASLGVKENGCFPKESSKENKDTSLASKGQHTTSKGGPVSNNSGSTNPVSATKAL